MKHMRPLEMVLLIVAIIVLVASMFAIGVYGPELVKLIQQGGGTGVENPSSLKIIITRIGDIVIKNLTSKVNACEMETVYGSTRAVAIDALTGQIIEHDCIQYGIK
jgi:hypothetical protein